LDIFALQHFQLLIICFVQHHHILTFFVDDRSFTKSQNPAGLTEAFSTCHYLIYVGDL